jgi:hypothetical protein
MCRQFFVTHCDSYHLMLWWNFIIPIIFHVLNISLIFIRFHELFDRSKKILLWKKFSLSYKNFLKQKKWIKISNKYLSYATLTPVLDSNSLLKNSISKKFNGPQNWKILIPLICLTWLNLLIGT